MINPMLLQECMGPLWAVMACLLAKDAAGTLNGLASCWRKSLIYVIAFTRNFEL